MNKRKQGRGDVGFLSRPQAEEKVREYMDDVKTVLFDSVHKDWVPFLRSQWIPGKPLFDSVWRMMLCSSFFLYRGEGGKKVGLNNPNLLALFEASAGSSSHSKKEEEEDEEAEESATKEDEEDIGLGPSDSFSSFLDEEDVKKVDRAAEKSLRKRISGYPSVDEWFRSMRLVPPKDVRGIITCLHPICMGSATYCGLAMGQDNTVRWRSSGSSSKGCPSEWQRLEDINGSFGRKVDETLAKFYLWITNQGLDETFSVQDEHATLEIPVLRNNVDCRLERKSFPRGTISRRNP